MSEKLSIGSTQIFRGGGQTLGESAVVGVCSTVTIYFAIVLQYYIPTGYNI